MNISETTPSKNSMALPVDEQLSKMREDPRVSEVNLKKILQDGASLVKIGGLTQKLCSTNRFLDILGL